MPAAIFLASSLVSQSPLKGALRIEKAPAVTCVLNTVGPPIQLCPALLVTEPRPMRYDAAVLQLVLNGIGQSDYTTLPAQAMAVGNSVGTNREAAGAAETLTH
jgi:hypothetical protein